MKFSSQKGLIGTIFLIAVALIALGYFGLDVRSILAKPQVQENLAYGWEMFTHLGERLYAALLPVIEKVRSLN